METHEQPTSTAPAIQAESAGTASSTDPAAHSRQRWFTWAALASLVAIVALVVLHPALRTLPADTWREIRSIRPLYVVLIIGLKVIQALLSALTWKFALTSAWPRAALSYRFVLGIDSGQDAVNTFSPARAGTWAMIGIFTLSIPGATVATVMAVWGVQSLAFWLFALINYAVIAIGLPQRTQSDEGWSARLGDFAVERPFLTGLLIAVVLAGVILAAVLGQRKIASIKAQIVDGLSILKTPSRYLKLIFLPSLAAYLARCISCALLLAAFGIPVTLWTVALALGSRAAAGAVRLAPGGIGTTQALEVVALRDYAPAEVVVAYSLVDLALTTLVNIGLAIPALVSARGWRGAKEIIAAADRAQGQADCPV